MLNDDLRAPAESELERTQTLPVPEESGANDAAAASSERHSSIRAAWDRRTDVDEDADADEDPDCDEESDSDDGDKTPRFTAVTAGGDPAGRAGGAVPFSLGRRAGVDLPKLDETVRSVEERIARQSAEYANLARTLERSRDTEAAAVVRANSIAKELASVRATLEAERERNRTTERALFEKNSEAEVAGSRHEALGRELAIARDENRGLREALTARDLTIKQLRNSLSERDSQFSSLQREHASVVPLLEARAAAAERIEDELREAVDQVAALERELENTKKALSVLRAAPAAVGAAAEPTVDFPAAAQQRIAEQSAEITQLREAANTAQDELAVVLAHLQASHRHESGPAGDDKLVAERQRARLAELDEENRQLKATLERTRGALDEREFLIRRLERSETDAANVLGRVQSSIERLGAEADVSEAGAPESDTVIAPRSALVKSTVFPLAQTDAAAHLVRIDGGRSTKHPLLPRTEIGRSEAANLRIDSAAVSRRHAVIQCGRDGRHRGCEQHQRDHRQWGQTELPAAQGR